MLQPQICRAAPSSAACSGLWPLLSQGVRGNFSASAGDHLWQLPATAAEHKSTVSQTLASSCTKCCWLHTMLDGFTGSPQHQLAGFLTLPSQDSAGTKAQNPFSQKILQCLYNLPQTSQAKSKFYHLLPYTGEEKQAVRVRDALTFTLGLAIQ